MFFALELCAFCSVGLRRPYLFLYPVIIDTIKTIRKIMSADVVSRKEVLRRLTLLKEPLHSRFGVTKLGIFGSVARDEMTPASDIDVVVEMRPNLFLRDALKVELESLLHRPVDVVRYRRNMDVLLKTRIDQEALYV